LRSDKPSKFIPFDLDTGLPQELDSARREALASLTWAQGQGHTTLVNVLPTHVRNVLAAARVTRTYHGRNTAELLTWIQGPGETILVDLLPQHVRNALAAASIARTPVGGRDATSSRLG
jgi:hypothetical protein